MNPTPTRTVFQEMTSLEIGLFYGLAAISTATFLWGCLRLLRRYGFRPHDLRRLHVVRALRVTLTHVWIARRSGWVGVAHAAVFYGFVILFVGTTILTIDEHVAKPLGISFWHDTFYETYSLFLDVFGFAMVVGLVFFAIRRRGGGIRLDYTRADGASFSPARSRYTADDWVFLWSLLIIGATGFLLESLRIAVDRPPFEVWSPVGYVVGAGLSAAGVTGSVADTLRHGFWWVHGAAALGFIAAIPYTKAMHMLTGPTAIAGRDDDVSRALPSEPETGYESLAELDVIHRIDLDACTKCGRCHEVCPARAAGLPLSPRDLVLDLREAQVARSIGGLVPDAVTSEAVWSCMQCNACVEVCPVGVEHVPIINMLRRGLVEAGNLDVGLQSVFQKVQTSGNSFGQSARRRTKWVKELEIELPDARTTPVDIVWFLGDFASLDPRNQRNSQALARVLQRAGVDFGYLYEGERTAGNDIRRAGEEGLFRSLVQDNIQTLESASFSRILTSDPHTFNTLRNEYPRLGAPWVAGQVLHHTVLLKELLDSQQLRVTRPIAGRGTYHDPCTLGRLNGIFEQPRDVIRSTGLELVDMPRNRGNSFCCGAGGGRVWMQDTSPPGSTRPSEARIAEAAEIDGLTHFVVACPKDVVMYDDALRSSGRDGISLAEISQLVLDSTAP